MGLRMSVCIGHLQQSRHDNPRALEGMVVAQNAGWAKNAGQCRCWPGYLIRIETHDGASRSDICGRSSWVDTT